MPTYTYRCTKCGHEFERFQAMSDEPVKRCPECKSKVQRTFHPVGIVLKGSGFHKTDYRTSKPPATESKSETKGSSETTSSDKTDKSPGDTSKKSETKSTSSKE